MFYDNLVNGVSYTFTVKAINIVGGSVSSAPSNSVIPGGGVAATVPDAPTGVTATAGANAATVQWTPPANNGGAAIQTYRVNIKPGTNYRLVTAPATSVLFDGLAGGRSVTFTVKAINAVGQSVASAPSNAVVPTGSATPPTKGGVWGSTPRVTCTSTRMTAPATWSTHPSASAAAGAATCSSRRRTSPAMATLTSSLASPTVT